MDSSDLGSGEGFETMCPWCNEKITWRNVYGWTCDELEIRLCDECRIAIFYDTGVPRTVSNYTKRLTEIEREVYRCTVFRDSVKIICRYKHKLEPDRLMIYADDGKYEPFFIIQCLVLQITLCIYLKEIAGKYRARKALNGGDKDAKEDADVEEEEVAGETLTSEGRGRNL